MYTLKVRQDSGKKKGFMKFYFHKPLIIKVARTGDDPVTSPILIVTL